MRVALAVLTLFIPVVGHADTLPLEDGAYLRNVKLCTSYQANDLDFIDFEVANNGREFGFIEVGCLVHSVKKIRSSRYHVNADCIEGGEAYQSSSFIDVLDDMSIRIDGGEKHHSCNVYLAKHKPLKKAGKLIDAWNIHNGKCRGGNWDNPSTQKACEKRQVVSQHLKKANWCYGQKGQGGHQYEWHLCNQFSLEIE